MQSFSHLIASLLIRIHVGPSGIESTQWFDTLLFVRDMQPIIQYEDYNIPFIHLFIRNPEGVYILDQVWNNI